MGGLRLSVGGERVSVPRFSGRPAGGRARLLFSITGCVVFLVSVFWALVCFRLFSPVESTMFRCHVYTRRCDKRGFSVTGRPCGVLLFVLVFCPWCVGASPWVMETVYLWRVSTAEMAVDLVG